MSDSKSGGPPIDVPAADEGPIPPEPTDTLMMSADPTDTFMTSTLTTAVQQARSIPSLNTAPVKNGGPFAPTPTARLIGGPLPPPPGAASLQGAVALSSPMPQSSPAPDVSRGVPGPSGHPAPTRPSSVPSQPTEKSRSSRPPAAAAPPSSVSSGAPSGQRSLQGSHVVRSRAYSFVLDAQGQPTELGSGRFAKAYLGEERWLESKTAFRRNVAIKILQKGVSEQDALRFQLEKELLERVQGHPNIITLYASGESDNPEFIPPVLRDKVENDFMILELCDMSLEERLKGSRNRGMRDDLLAYPMRERLFRVLEYMLPVASAIECAHLERNIVHRDLKPANVLLRLPSPNLQGATLDVRVADFNVGKVREDVMNLSMTRLQGVPGTLFFQSPEQETNAFELLVNVEQGSSEVDYFEDFYMYITQNDSFEIFNRHERYPVAGADRAKKKLFLATPFREPSETNVRAKIVKSVDRPADIYSLGAMFYYLVSGAYGNPKTLYDAFHKFIEYEKDDEQNTVEAYIDHEYEVINSLRAPKKEGDQPLVAPADRFFSYKHYLDGNGDLIDQQIMRIIGKAMIRNKPDSYCQAWDVNTTGISLLVADLVQLYADYGVDASARSAVLGRFVGSNRRISPIRRWFGKWFRRAMNLRKPRLASSPPPPK